jgi:hypothetical protein
MIGPYLFVFFVSQAYVWTRIKNVIMVFNFFKETNYYTNMYTNN